MEMNLITHISFPNVPGYEDITEGIGEGSMKFSATLVDENFKFGQYNASCFEITLYGISDVSSQRMFVYQEDELTGDRRYVFNGIVDSVKTDRDKISRHIIAYDDLYSKGKLNCSSWWNNLWTDKSSTARKTILQVLQSLATFIDVELSITNLSISLLASEITIGYKPLGESITVKDVLSMLCEFITCFPEMSAVPSLDDFNGILRIIRPFTYSYGDLSDNLDSSESELEEYNPKNITGLVCVDGENKLRYANYTTVSNVYTIYDNLFVDCLYKAFPLGTPYGTIYSSMQTIFSNLTQITPANVKLIYSVPVFDRVTSSGGLFYTYDWVGCKFNFTDSENTVHTCLVNRIELSGVQLVDCVMDCIISEYLPSNANYDNGTQMLVVKTDEMQSAIDDTQQVVTEVEEDVETAQSDIEELQTALSTVQTTVTDLQDTVDILQEYVGDLQTSVSTIESDMSDVQSDLATLQTDLSSVETELTTVEDTITTIQDTITSIETDISNIQDNITTLSTDLSSVSDEVSVAQQDITQLQGTVASLESNLSSVITTVNALTVSVTNISTDLSTAKTNIANLQTFTSNIKDYVKLIGTDANGWSYKIWSSGRIEATKSVTLEKGVDFTGVSMYTRGSRSTGWYELVNGTSDTITTTKPVYLSTSNVEYLSGVTGYVGRSSTDSVSHSIIAQIIKPVVRTSSSDIAFNVLTLDDGESTNPNQAIYKLATKWYVIGRSTI